MEFTENIMGSGLGLTVAGCRQRQEELRRHLRRLNLDAALIVDRGHVYYLTGYRARSVFVAAMLLTVEDGAFLAAPLPPEKDVAADRVEVFPSNFLGTLVDDQIGEACRTLRPHIRESCRIGVDVSLGEGFCESIPWTPLQQVLLSMRRRKHADEVALLKRAIAATEAAYGFAREAVHGGASEVELVAGMLSAATAAAGEILGEFGNDFQIGAVGSLPRNRVPQPGETAILDLSVVLREYRSDMCRTFVVGRQPSESQQSARARLIEALDYVRHTAKAGSSCKELYHALHGMLEGYRGWRFPHHLGHGIGLSPHEAPRLNPHWDDVLEPGDVITAEPGLYAPELRAGLRIEEIFLVSETGLEQLSSFPTELA
jgi:Xaa-Pro dipeptidase